VSAEALITAGIYITDLDFVPSHPSIQPRDITAWRCSGLSRNSRGQPPDVDNLGIWPGGIVPASGGVRKRAVRGIGSRSKQCSVCSADVGPVTATTTKAIAAIESLAAAMMSKPMPPYTHVVSAIV
jgi:hypothetical protein